MTTDNASNNTTAAGTVATLHIARQLVPSWDALASQLGCVSDSPLIWS